MWDKLPSHSIDPKRPRIRRWFEWRTSSFNAKSTTALLVFSPVAFFPFSISFSSRTMLVRLIVHTPFHTHNIHHLGVLFNRFFVVVLSALINVIDCAGRFPELIAQLILA
jgi:hypothetical protein